MAQLTVLRSCDAQKSSYGKSVEIDYATGNFLSLLQSGRTAQVVTVQGKNLWDFKKWTNTKFSVTHGTATKTDTSLMLTATANDAYTEFMINKGVYYLPVNPTTNYTLSFKKKNGVAGRAYVFFYATVSDTTWIDAVSTPGTTLAFTTPRNCNFITMRVGVLNSGETETFSEFQLELGSTATAYAPFVSNSPSPDYPAPITGVTKTTVNGVDYAIPQTLYDGDSYDYVSGTGQAVKGKVTLNGTEIWNGNPSGDTSYPNYLHAYMILSNRLSNQSSTFSTHFTCVYSWTPNKECVYAEQNTKAVYIVISKTRLATPDIAGLKAWLAANPVTVLYQLSTPIVITGTPQNIPTAMHNTITNDGGGQISATYNFSLEPVAKTSRAFMASSTKELMRAYTMTATLLNKDAARKYITTGAVLKIGGQLYDLSGYKQNSGKNNVTQIDGRHVGYRLNKYSVPVQYSFVGTARQIVQDMLDRSLDGYGRPASTEFTIGAVVDVGTQSFSLGNDQPITLREAILSIQAIGVEVDFDNFTLNFPLKCGTGNTKTFKFGRDLCDLNRTWDVDNGMTYDVAIANLQRIPGHVGDVFGVGDEVVIEDDFIGDAVSRRIISYTKSFDDPSKDAITLGVFVRTFADVTTAMKIDINGAQSTAEGAQNAADAAQQTANAANELAEGSVQVGTSYNNVDITHEYGFRSTSADGLMRTINNGTDGFVIQRLYNGKWVTIWQADSASGKTVAYNLDHSQKVETGGAYGFTTWKSTDGGNTWTQTSGLDAAGGFNVQQGNFAGNLQAAGGTFKGRINWGYGGYLDQDGTTGLVTLHTDGQEIVIDTGDGGMTVKTGKSFAQFEDVDAKVMTCTDLGIEDAWGDGGDIPISAPSGSKTLHFKHGLFTGMT